LLSTSPVSGGQDAPVALPLLLAGPILRRVEPTLVTVWVALSQNAAVQLRVWEGQLSSRDAHEASAEFVQSLNEQTWRVGESLHLALLTARIPPESGKTFTPNTTYCYDVQVTPADGSASEPFTLKTLDMLEATTVDHIAHVPLGYEPGLLPSFAPPPSELTDLRLLYGSCRRPSHPDPDAMVWIDDHLLEARRYKDPRARPHQLFLGGDQIYADDVHVLHMLLVTELGQELVGTKTTDGVRTPLEQVDVGQILERTVPVAGDAEFPRAAYSPSTDAEAKAQPLPPDTRLPADRAHLPEEHRKDLTQRAAQFTSTDGANHLISIGEFAAMYLSVWSNAVWPTEVPLARRLPDAAADDIAMPLAWTAELGEDERIRLPALEFPEKIPLFLYREAPKNPKPDTRTPDQKQQDAEKGERREQQSLRKYLRIHADFLAGLARVRRVLANIPTYMVLDDHDVTDDYFLNPVWRDRVLDTHLGQTILRNAMLAYALFQDWGNDPLRYDSGPRAELLTRATELFPTGTLGPEQAATDRLDVLFGHDLRNEVNLAGQYDAVRPPISWHFSVDGPKHRVIALDNRTRRSYVSDLGPPGNVSPEAQADQIPQPPLPAGIELLVVVAPLQVIGPPLIDDLVAPLVYRLTDLGGLGSDSDLNPSSPTGIRQMTGTDPDAIEAWAIDAVTFEHLLRRLAAYRQVVLLSGDVHNSSGTAMSYWRKDDVTPSRIVQFTSSGFKNVMPAKITAVDRSAGFAQQMIRAGLGVERLGWDRAADDLVLLPDGFTALDLVAATRRRLRTEPVMLPTWGWPDDQDDDPETQPETTRSSRLNPAKPPDWRWRTQPLLDRRADLARPEPIRPRQLDDQGIEGKLADPETTVEAYRLIAGRHQSSLRQLRNARQILFRSNFGLVRFEVPEDGPLTAVHEVYTAFTDPDDPNPAARPIPQPYLLQTTPLVVDDEEPPTRLRAKVIEVPPQEETG
jgi:hypothetical protein